MEFMNFSPLVSAQASRSKADKHESIHALMCTGWTRIAFIVWTDQLPPKMKFQSSFIANSGVELPRARYVCD